MPRNCTGAPLATGSETPAAGAAFPEAWIGSWQGEVTAFGPGGERMRFDMLREISATEDPERFAWTTIYAGEAGTQVRKYTVLVRDRATGAYAIDEHNGIVLDAIGNVAVMFAALGVWGTATGWPDLIVATIMAGLFLSSAFQNVRQAIAERREMIDHKHAEV